MSTMPKTIVALLLSFLILLPWESEAQTPGHTLYVKNRLSAQFVAGALFSPVSWVHEHPVINYAQTNLRFGWMATEPTKSKLIGKSNFELLFELTNSAVFLGPGNYLRGFTLLGRYNLLLSNPRWALYFQIGAGVVVNDIYEDLSQSAVGQAVEFTPQGSLGVRYFIRGNWTLDGEAMFHHISNGGLSQGRNGGVNAVGGFLGVTYYFDRLWRK
jgi:hypothetical protein